MYRPLGEVNPKPPKPPAVGTASMHTPPSGLALGVPPSTTPEMDPPGRSVASIPVTASGAVTATARRRITPARLDFPCAQSEKSSRYEPVFRLVTVYLPSLPVSAKPKTPVDRSKASTHACRIGLPALVRTRPEIVAPLV